MTTKVTKVTKESLAAKINRLEGIRASLGDLSISEEYQLEAYRMLHAIVSQNPVYLGILDYMKRLEEDNE